MPNLSNKQLHFLSLIHYSNAMRQYTNYGNASNDKSAHPRGGPGLPPGANNTIHDSATVYNEQSATGPSGGAISSQGPPQSGGPIREASQTVTEKTLVTPGSPMESLRRRHMTNQTYRQPGVQAGPLPMRSPANPNKPVPGPNIVGHPGVAVDPKSPAGSLVAVPIIETQIGMKRTLATTANIHHLPEQPFPTTATADAYPDPGRPSCLNPNGHEL